MASDDKISIKDIFAKMSSVEGIASEIVKLAPIITQTEKDVIRLQEADKQLEGRMKKVEEGQMDLVKRFDDAQKTNQKILVAIGVVAIITNLFGPIIFNRLFP